MRIGFNLDCISDHLFHILLVEDNPADVFIFTEGLRAATVQCRLTIAATGREAIDYLQQKESFAGSLCPDLVVLDLNLPGIHGHEVLKCVKEDVRLQHTPVVILTSSIDQEDVSKSYSCGANSYFAKPKDFDLTVQLVSTIKDYWFTLALLPSEDGIPFARAGSHKDIPQGKAATAQRDI